MAHLDRVFHSLSDSTCRAVIAQLAIGPASIGDLAQRHHMALPSFMKHIRVLEESEIISSRKVGRVRYANYALIRSPPHKAGSNKSVAIGKAAWIGSMLSLKQWPTRKVTMELNNELDPS
jgi:DNA-binding transcriptional ArsR family regulator